MHDKGSVLMLKMFTTQLIGRFQQCQKNNEEMIEDAARLLAQAIVGEGTIYIKGFHEMEAVMLEALEGTEVLKKAKPFTDLSSLTTTDRLLLITRYSHDSEAVMLGKALLEKQIPFTAISTHVTSDEANLTDLGDVHLNLGLTKGVLPGENGERFCFPNALAALYLYHCLKLSLDDILVDYAS
jgi:hypothetical protein